MELVFSVAVQTNLTQHSCFLSRRGEHFCVSGKRLRNDLIHVVVLVGRQTTDKMYFGSFLSQPSVLLIQLCVLFLRYGIVRIAFSLRKLKHNARLRVFLTSEILELSNTGVELLVRIVDNR